jgi:hypothetical protein
MLKLASASLALAVLGCTQEPLHSPTTKTHDDNHAGEGEGSTSTGEGEGEGTASTGEGEGVTSTGEGEGVSSTGEGEGEGVAARVPPPMPAYSQGTCPILVGGATKDTSLVTGFPTTSGDRQFRLLVPASYDGTQPMALMFAWHWLNADSGSFVDQGDLETAIQQFPFIVVLPDKLRLPNGNKAYQFDWPFVETWGAPSEVQYFDDLLACVTQQFNIDDNKIYSIGVSAGGLWATYLSTKPEADHFAAVESLSGGLGSFAYNGTGWSMQYQPQANKFPAIVLWGGDTDWLGISFKDASIAYRDALLGDGHFVVQCIHDQGHAVPPITPPPGETKFTFLWQFMMDHPYTVPAGTSPWQQSGLPSSAPSWCTILGN